MKGLAPSKKQIPPLLTQIPKERGIKRVPRKIEDFSGCLKGIGLPNHSVIATGIPLCYNFDVLGNSLAVGQRTLDPPGKVRILLPQPEKVMLLPHFSLRPSSILLVV